MANLSYIGMYLMAPMATTQAHSISPLSNLAKPTTSITLISNHNYDDQLLID
jgi:hypothetical protein